MATIGPQNQNGLDTCWAHSTVRAMLHEWRKVHYAKLPSYDFLLEKMLALYGTTGKLYPDFPGRLFGNPKQLLERCRLREVGQDVVVVDGFPLGSEFALLGTPTMAETNPGDLCNQIASVQETIVELLDVDSKDWCDFWKLPPLNIVEVQVDNSFNDNGEKIRTIQEPVRLQQKGHRSVAVLHLKKEDMETFISFTMNPKNKESPFASNVLEETGAAASEGPLCFENHAQEQADHNPEAKEDEEIVVGHTVCVDWAKSWSGDCLYTKNSWGTECGNNGCCKIHLDAFRDVIVWSFEWREEDIHPDHRELYKKNSRRVKMMEIPPEYVERFEQDTLCERDYNRYPVTKGTFSDPYDQREEIPCCIKEVSSAARDVEFDLDHPNIAKVYGYVNPVEQRTIPPTESTVSSPLGRTIWIVQELCEETLEEFMEKEHPLDARKKVIVDICAAVEYLQSIKITHRDIKPSNIMRVGDTWKLIDFGIAKQNAATTRVTCWGTADWSDPIQGHREELLALSSEHLLTLDMYSIGKLIRYCIHERGLQEHLSEITENCCTTDDRAKRPHPRQVAENVAGIRSATAPRYSAASEAEKEYRSTGHDSHTCPFLHWCAGTSRTEAVNEILRKGSTPYTLKNPTGEHALHYALVHRSTDEFRNRTTIAALIRHSMKDVDVEKATRFLNAQTALSYTPLHLAAKLGCIPTTRRLLATNRVQLHLATQEGSTALHLAATHGHVEIVRMLLHHMEACGDEHPSRSVHEMMDCFGFTPLECAVNNGHNAVVEVLVPSTSDKNRLFTLALESNRAETLRVLAKNLNPEDVQKAIVSPTVLASEQLELLRVLQKKASFSLPFLGGKSKVSPVAWESIPDDTLESVIRQDSSIETIRFLVETGKRNAKAEDSHRQSALHFAALYSSLEVVQYLVEECKCDANLKSIIGQTPLHLAAETCSLEMVQFFVEKCKCDANPKDKFGRTPLHIAANNSSLEVVQYLVEKGKCDVNLKDRYGRTPLLDAARHSSLEVVQFLVEKCNCDANLKDKHGQTPLNLAAETCSLEMVQFLVEKCNYDANLIDSTGRTPLHRAAENSSLEVVQYLVEACKFDGNLKNGFGKTPLHLAAETCSLEMVQLLVEKCKCDANLKCKMGQTPLHYAAEWSSLEVVQYLVEECKCDANLKNGNGKTPLHLAAENSFEVVRYLEKNCK